MNSNEEIIGRTFDRDGYTFRVVREYMPGVYECRGAGGEVVVPLSETDLTFV